MTNLWKRDHYDAYCDYVFGRKIIEYDLDKANISVLRDAGRISADQFYELLAADRMIRQYTIGCMIRDDPSINEVLHNGFMNARKILCETLELNDNNILHVVKDAMFVVLPSYMAAPERIDVGEFTRFSKRNTYQSYYKISRGLHMYTTYLARGRTIVNIRGMSSAAYELHEPYFLSILADLATTEIASDVRAAYEKTRNLAEVFHTYDYHFFRRFDSQSLYDFKQMSIFSNYQAEYVDEGSIDMVDPSYNLNLIRRFGNIYLSDMIIRW